jgi:hypothetical protein
MTLVGPEALARFQAVTPPLPTRLLYGGLTEEILTRFGLMTALVWALWRLRSQPALVPASDYQMAAALAALLFALGICQSCSRSRLTRLSGSFVP